MAMVAYFGMSENAAISAFPFYLDTIPRQWYFQLSESVRSSLESLKLAFLERFQKRTTHFDINLLNIKQYMEETVDDYMARVSRLTTEYELPTHLLVGITIQGLKPDLRQIVMPQSPDTLEKIRQLALVAEQTLKSTGVANTSLAASIQQLEDKLLSSFSEKLEASAAVISNVNSNFNDQSHTPPFRMNFRQNAQKNFRSNHFRPPNKNSFQNSSSNQFMKCQGCGGNCTDRRNCKAFGKSCLKCGRQNHFASVCRSAMRANNYR